MNEQSESERVLRGGDYPFGAYTTHYEHNAHCRNCGHLNGMRIRKGLTIPDGTRGIDCENCGCRL